MADVTIRECTEEDLDAVSRLQQCWEAEGITQGLKADSREDLIGRLGPFFFVADMDGAIEGYVFGSAKVSEGSAVMPQGERYLEVDEIYVRPQSRGKGVGGMLLDKLLQTARGNGIGRFSVYSATKDMDGILEFYRRHGFQSWYVQMFI